MPIQNELCFVQFLHPGKEHSGYRDGLKEWNTGQHKRKFVENPGRCRRQKKEYQGPLQFWAEWEAQSELLKKIDDLIENGPKYVCQPFYAIPKRYRDEQNTDPFVFDGFRYTLCQQFRLDRPTQLNRLVRGSVILFGSCVGGQFALDTVFVVDSWTDHDGFDYPKLRHDVPDGYWDVALSAWYKVGLLRCGSPALPDVLKRRYRLYQGATVDNPVEEMFSFFPCQPANQCSHGFARPVVKLPGVVNDRLMMGTRLNRGLKAAQSKKLWNEVQRQVTSAGLWLGVQADLPKRR